MKRAAYSFVVIIAAVVVTAVGIDAADTLQGVRGTMLAGLMGQEAQARCPHGMVEVPAALSFSCVDAYEVSASAECTVAAPANPADSLANIADTDCEAVSEAAATPWRYVARADAERLCARAGKRLPTAEEWYRAALDTHEAACQTDGGSVGKTGAVAECKAASGAYDMVGNVWEWVADDIYEGVYRERPLPPSGHVLAADATGVATRTGTAPENGTFGQAYFWARSEGSYGMIRGGFYGSRSDAGVYTVHAHTPTDFTGEAVGFRCVR